MSEEKEQEYLRAHPRTEDRVVGYGVILKYFAIRDMQGIEEPLIIVMRMMLDDSELPVAAAFGLDHMGSNGRKLISASFNLVMRMSLLSTVLHETSILYQIYIHHHIYHTSIHTYIHTYIYISAQRIYQHISSYINATYKYIHTTYTYIYIHTYIHTYIHMYIFLRSKL